jgi:DNA-binding transcriptional LysR family regulator
MIDSRQLEMFQQVIDTGSFSAAARALHCSQPAVSQQMRALERAMGGPMFTRVGKSLELTDAGKVLARHSSSILADLAVAKLQVQAISALDLGTVRICAFPSANASLVPQTAAALRAAAPHMRLELIEQEPPTSFAMLRRAECDVVVAFSYEGDDSAELAAGMIHIPLLAEPLELLVPVGHRLASHVRLDAGEPPAAVPLAALGGELWIAGCPKCRVTFTAACASAGFVPDIVCSTDDNMALQSLVASGLGVALVPRMVRSFLHHPRVTAVPVDPTTWRRVSAYTWPDLARVDAIAETLQALKTVAVSYSA